MKKKTYGEGLARIYKNKVATGADPIATQEMIQDKYNPDAEELVIMLSSSQNN